MRAMILVSLLLNLCVLIPVCTSLLMGADWTNAAYGPTSPARQILLSVYLAIAVVSALLLVRPEPGMVATLLLLQVAYKLATPILVGSMQNPVVVTNIGIATVHMVTLALIWRAINHAAPA